MVGQVLIACQRKCVNSLPFKNSSCVCVCGGGGGGGVLDSLSAGLVLGVAVV